MNSVIRVINRRFVKKYAKTHYADKKFLFTIPPEKCIIIHK